MIVDEIKKTIEGAVTDATVYVLDPMNDGMHLQAIVISLAFDGMPLVKQHQVVMNSLKESFTQFLHALGLKTFTPEKWEEVKEQYNL